MKINKSAFQVKFNKQLMEFYAKHHNIVKKQWMKERIFEVIKNYKLTMDTGAQRTST